MKHLIEASTKQANERKTFGQPISSYGLIKEKMGQMLIDCYTAEAAVTMVGPVRGEITLPTMFGDRAVLQRGETVPVWGGAAAGGALRPLDVVDVLERRLGKPVVCSNQAMVWDCLRLAGVEDRFEGYGALLREH